ncbi:DUF2115 domain-containing protein [Methanobrevibacter sp. OttesenSCG-928-K11]|nr:DUF2115 domain-containing protein [Methanobrevibacter sp. OttesenSCG-928-K11]
MLFDDLKSLKNQEKVSKNDILKILKKWVKNISVFDIMDSANYSRDSFKYVQKEYQKHFEKIYIEDMTKYIQEISQSKLDYHDNVNKSTFLTAIDFFEKQENAREEEYKEKYPKQSLIYYLMCIYTTFILDQPIHNTGSIFPGHTKIRYENGTYYCPVKSNNTDNPKAVCRFCVAKQG